MLEPIGDKLLLDPIIVEQQTAGGIYLPDSARQVPDKGIILSVGEDVKSDKLVKGVTVLFRKNSGTTVTYNEKEYIVLPTKEVIGIIKGE